MKIEIKSLIDGAREATGLTVIIDVFRAFSLECYLYNKGVKEIIPVGTVEEAFAYKEKNPDYILIGERHGKMCDGFNFGNSPSQTKDADLKGKIIIHTTSAGTKGVANAKNASAIIGGSIVNAKAIANYIKKKNPKTVTLVPMGLAGIEPTTEDELCAKYIKSLLEGNEMENIEEKCKELRFNGGEKFFNPNTQNIYPMDDFYMCTKPNIFDFVVEIHKNYTGFYTRVNS
ncbi:MAG: 2-phosphosulfolactate phosphatase [Lachnospiraceae bacterium]|jgi:2-phosphosulfolactate phosphatase|nr:2-phosphosulfolactate phosphatase [Lachnospiraceae bacterium]